MIKYLPKDKTEIKDLSETRADDNIGIVFCHTITDIKNLCYEISQNMVKLAIDSEGNSLIDDMAMDDSYPSDTLKNKLIEKEWSNVSSLMLKVYDDILDSINTIDNTSIYIPVINNPLCEENVLKIVDDAMVDVMVYGILTSWFTDVNNEALKAMSLTEYNTALSKLIRAVRKMESALLRKKVSSPLFDSMIKDDPATEE